MRELAVLLCESLRDRPAWFPSQETSFRDSHFQPPHTGCSVISRQATAAVSLTLRQAPMDRSLRTEIIAEPWLGELQQLDRRPTACGSRRALHHSSAAMLLAATRC